MMTQQLPKPPLPLSNALLKSSLVIYGAMFIVGFEICWWYHKSIQTLFGVLNVDWFLVLRVSGLGILFLTLGQYCLEDFFPSYRRLKMTFALIFKGLNPLSVLLLAAVSSIGEEMLFRGAMQPFLGVWLTAVIFAIMHIDPEGKLSVWTLWALIGGIVMGLSVNATGTLWPAILIHFGVNAISINRVTKLADKESLRRSNAALLSGREP